MTDTAPHADQQLRDRIAQAIASVTITIGPNSLALLKDGHTLGLTGGEIDAMALSALAAIQPELDRLRAQLAGVWPCTCGHLPDRHRYDAAIGRNFCRGCRPEADLHDYDPAPSA